MKRKLIARGLVEKWPRCFKTFPLDWAIFSLVQAGSAAAGYAKAAAPGCLIDFHTKGYGMKIESRAVIKEVSINEARGVVGGLFYKCVDHPTKVDKHGNPVCDKRPPDGK